MAYRDKNGKIHDTGVLMPDRYRLGRLAGAVQALETQVDALEEQVEFNTGEIHQLLIYKFEHDERIDHLDARTLDLRATMIGIMEKVDSLIDLMLKTVDLIEVVDKKRGGPNPFMQPVPLLFLHDEWPAVCCECGEWEADCTCMPHMESWDISKPLIKETDCLLCVGWDPWKGCTVPKCEGVKPVTTTGEELLNRSTTLTKDKARRVVYDAGIDCRACGEPMAFDKDLRVYACDNRDCENYNPIFQPKDKSGVIE